IPPGATADSLPRIIGEKLSAKWGQPVVVENRPGAALNIGAEAVARAEPDGYTLLATPPSPLAVNQSLYSRLGYDPGAFVPGHVDMMFDNLGNAFGPVTNGRLKGLGVGSDKRIAALPDVLAIAEVFPGFLSTTWFAIVAPPRTPPGIATRLSSTIAEIIRQPD